MLIPGKHIKHALIVAGFFLLVIPSAAQCIPDSVTNTGFTVRKGDDYCRQYDCTDTATAPVFSPATFFDSLGVISLYEAQQIACTKYGIKAESVELLLYENPAKNTWEVRGNSQWKLVHTPGYGNARTTYTVVIIDTKGRTRTEKRKYRFIAHF